jgi:hypothetical protein
MKSPTLMVLLVVGITIPWTVAAKEKPTPGPQPAAPIGWLDLHAGSRNLSVSEGDLRKASRSLERGALLPVFKTKGKRGVTFAQVGALNFDTGASEIGWVEIDSSDLKPPDSYPSNDELLRLLGAPYLDDFAAAHTNIARFLVHQGQGPPALLCYLVTAPLSMAKLAIFTLHDGKYLPGEALNFPLSEMQAGVTFLEIRNLAGDGSDCVISHEPFHELTQTYGVNLRIRKIADGQFQLIWQAPIEFKNFSQYSAKIQILRPPEENIGAPGTVTTAAVTFRAIGKGQEPFWKGKVEFFVFGRDSAVDSVNIEKACPWDGKKFLPLR